MNVADEVRRIEKDLAYIKIQLSNVRAYGIGDVTDITSYADSPMIITGADFSNGSNAGTLKVGALTALLRNAASDIAPLVYFTLAEQDNIVMAAADVRYHVVLTSTPAIVIQVANANGTTEIGIGTCMKEADDTVHFAEAGMRLQNGVAKLHRRATTLRYIELAAGCVITETGGALTMGIAAGVAYEGINRFTPFSAGAFDSNVADTFTRIYRDGGGGFTKQVGQTVIDSDNYDDNSGGVAAVTVNQYSVHFIYLHPEDEHVYSVYGRSSFKLAEAIAEQPYGDLPMYITDFGVLLGKIITKKGTAIFDYVQMVTDTFFTGTAAADHANLTNLPWLSSAHTGTANRMIGFGGAGAAQERTFAQVLADLSAQAAAAFDWNDQDLSKINAFAGKEIVTPANPAAGYNKLYCKADDNWYTLDSDGNEAVFAAGGGGAHAILSATHSDTVADVVVAGDIIYGDNTPDWTRLSKGDNDEVLTLKVGLPSWEPAAGGTPTEVGVQIFDSDFDSLALGDVDGLGVYTYAGTWVNNSGAGCTAEIVVDPGGGQMLSLDDASGANISEAYIDFDAGNELLTGIVEMKVKVSSLGAGARGYFFIRDKDIASEQGGYFRGDSDDIYYRGASGGTAKLVDVVVDTWYIVKWYFCRLGNYGVWWIDNSFEQSRVLVGSGSKFDRIILYTRDTYSGNTFDIKYIKVWNLNYV